MRRLNKMLLRMLVSIVLLGSTWASAEISPIRAWDEALPELELAKVKVEGEHMSDFLVTFMRQHFLRINYFFSSSLRAKGPFAYEAENVTVREVLDAVCSHYGVQWSSDADSGVLWVLPIGKSVDDLLYPKTVIDNPWPGMPMLNDLLTRVGRSFFQHRADEPDVKPLGLYVTQRGTSYMAMFDYPVNISPGTYSVSEVLRYCLTLSPSFAFSIWDDEDEIIEGYKVYAIDPISLTVSTCDDEAAGRKLLFRLLADNSDTRPQEVLKALLKDPNRFPFSTYLAWALCRGPDFIYQQALLAATTFSENVTVINGFFFFGCNFWTCRYPLWISEYGATLLNEGNYTEEAPSLVLPLLFSIVRTIEDREEQRALLAKFSTMRSFEATELKGIEVQVGRAAYLNEQIWQALVDRESDIYIDTGGWAVGFLPPEYAPLERLDSPRR